MLQQLKNSWYKLQQRIISHGDHHPAFIPVIGIYKIKNLIHSFNIDIELSFNLIIFYIKYLIKSVN
jgi:hypothetical protein